MASSWIAGDTDGSVDWLNQMGFDVATIMSLDGTLVMQKPCTSMLRSSGCPSKTATPIRQIPRVCMLAGCSQVPLTQMNRSVLGDHRGLVQDVRG